METGRWLYTRSMPQTEPTPAPWRMLAAGETWIGNREHDEDTVLLRPDLSLYLLADGAGGENAGNVASTLATTTIAHCFEESQKRGSVPAFDSLGLSVGARRLASAVQQANRDIIQIAKSSHRHRGMGTTVVASYFDRTQGLLHLAHVGDSRCYRLRDGRLELLTTDHTLVNDVLELEPDIDEARAARLPRNVITRALGMSDTVRVSVRSWQIAPKDRYLLCSDGLTDAVGEDQIADALGLASEPEEQVRLLLDLARDAEAEDNVAILALACELAAGVTSLPKRFPTQLRPSPARPVAPREGHPRDSDYPEILVVDRPPTEDSSPQIHLVPPAPRDQGMLDALTGFYERTRTYPPSPQQPGPQDPGPQDPEGTWEDD